MATLKALVRPKLLVWIQISKVQLRNIMWFSEVPKNPPDPIFGVIEEFKKDTSENKVNLAIGVYRTDDNKPLVLNCVRQAEEQIKSKKMNKEYPGIIGSQRFCDLSFGLIAGADEELCRDPRVVKMQTISGTGALGIAACFLGRFFPDPKVIYISQPAWENYENVFGLVGLEVKRYRYYDAKNNSLDFCGMMEDLNNLKEGSLILLQASAHNPTGFDPTTEQWLEIAELCKKKSFYVICDTAYQGFASGNIERDVFSVRVLLQKDINMMVCQSYSKNMGLYGERIGCLNVITDCRDEAAIVTSQLKRMIRSIYSNPPINGARIVEEILSDNNLKQLWLQEVKAMSIRMQNIRKTFKEKILEAGSKHNWDHITNQIGMFSFTGLSREAVQNLKTYYHIYMINNSRISVASLNSKNVEYVAKAFHEVTGSSNYSSSSTDTTQSTASSKPDSSTINYSSTPPFIFTYNFPLSLNSSFMPSCNISSSCPSHISSSPITSTSCPRSVDDASHLSLVSPLDSVGSFRFSRFSVSVSPFLLSPLNSVSPFFCFMPISSQNSNPIVTKENQIREELPAIRLKGKL